MKKIFLFVVLGLLWCNTGFADQAIKTLLKNGFKISKEEIFQSGNWGIKVITLQKKNSYAVCTIAINQIGGMRDAICKIF